MGKRFNNLVLPAAALLAAGAVFLAHVHNPPVVPIGACPDRFSGAAAMQHLDAIAQEPRLWGSNDSARAYIFDALSGMGLQPEIQSFASVLTRNKPVRNVTARIKGSASTGAVLMTAHYDTMPLSPGSGDDGTGTVILMEVMRALNHGPAPKNDIIIVLTDAEEFGLAGAVAFADRHPWMKDVRLAINLEGVVEGPVVMWRTGPAQGWLIRELFRSGSRPALLPYLFSGPSMGDTDFTIFALKGIPGYDFFTVYSYPTNHAPEDLPSGINPGSVQRAGDTLLKLVRHLGGIPLPPSPPVGKEMVYFDLLGFMVCYPTAWMPVMNSAVGLLAAYVVTRRMRWTKVALGFGFSAAMVLVLPLLVTLVWRFIEMPSLDMLFGGTVSSLIAIVRPHDWPHITHDAWFLAAYLSGTAIVTFAATKLIRRKVETTELLAGSLLVWTVLMFLTAAYMPRANYFFLLTVLVYAAVLLTPSIVARGAALWCSLVVFLPVLYFLYLASGLGTLTVTSALTVLVSLLVSRGVPREVVRADGAPLDAHPPQDFLHRVHQARRS